MKKRAAASVASASVSVMTHMTYGEEKTKQMMTLPDEIKTYGKKMTNTMLTDKMTLSDDDKTDDDTSNGEKRTQTKRQMIENILLMQANFNEAVVEFIKRAELKPPRPSRVRRQEKRRKELERKKELENAKSYNPAGLQIPSIANPCKDVLHNKFPGQQNSSNKIPGQQNLATKFQRNLANLALTFQKLPLYCLTLPETRNKIKKGKGK